MTKLSWMTLAKGARQLVVQEALLEKQTGGISHKEDLVNQHEQTFVLHVDTFPARHGVI